MVISLILFRCAKHSILPGKTGTWEKRVPSSYGQNSIAQSLKMQYLSQFFFLYHSFLTIQQEILLQRLSVFNSKLVISVEKRRGFSKRLCELTREKFSMRQEQVNIIFIQSSKKVSLSGNVHSNKNHSLLGNPLIPIQDLNTNFHLEPKNRKPKI